jgi:uncharacterized tellurite resistance protein B-like protein
MTTLTQQHSAYHQGLLHCAHLLMSVDGMIDELETNTLQAICQEENIPEIELALFEQTVSSKSEKQIYLDGLNLLNECTEQERLCALVHLYRLTESDSLIHRKEVRFLLYSLKGADVDFEDIELTARMVKARKACA